MIKDLSAEQTMFSIANRLFRERRYEDAISIYEYLRTLRPEFKQYFINETVARNLFYGKNENTNKYHLEKASDIQKRLRIADRLSLDFGRRSMDAFFSPEEVNEYPQILLSYANAEISTGYGGWLRELNSYLSSHGMAKIGLKSKPSREGGGVFLNITGASLEPVTGPLVTICMSCFNAERYVEHAVRSILNQSYRNLELLLVNDQSEDATLAILERLAKEDVRISLTNNENNQGTYVSRNNALQRAKGEYFTIMDADDFSLPDRIARQVSHLEANPDQVGMMTNWVRMKEEGFFVFREAWGGVYEHEAVATLMFRTKLVNRAIGYWDSVRFAADTEFLFRMRKKFGYRAVPLMKFPTEISLYHDASLTNDPITGISAGGIVGLSPVRIKYRKSWMEWHEKVGVNHFMPFPLKNRRFDAPEEMKVDN